MARCSFTFGQIEELLAVVHRIDPAKRTAFQGRLKHLQRWGFPTGAKPGKGRSIDYSVEHLFMMVLVMELIQSGMPPKLCADLISSHWSQLRVTVYLNLFSEYERRDAGSEEASDWCWLFRPEALREISSEGMSEYDHHEAVLAVETGSLARIIAAQGEAFGGVMGASWRTLVINGGPLVRGIGGLIERRFKWATVSNLRHDLLEANEIAAQTIAEASDEFAKTMKGWKPTPYIQRPVAERYPPLIVEMARVALAVHGNILRNIDVPDGAIVEISALELEELRDAGIIEIEMEGAVLTEKGHLIRELMAEEQARDDRNTQA